MNILYNFFTHPRGMAGIIFFLLGIFNIFPVQAQTLPEFSRDIKELTTSKSPIQITKREVIPGVVVFNRQNGCLLKSPVSRNFLENGTTIETSSHILISGNSIPKFQSKHKQPWQSKLTDYQGGEYKIMLMQIGYHPQTLIQVEESEKKLLDAQNICSVATYQIIKNNLNLLQPISQKRQDELSLSVEQHWEIYFSNYFPNPGKK